MKYIISIYTKIHNVDYKDDKHLPHKGTLFLLPFLHLIGITRRKQPETYKHDHIESMFLIYKRSNHNYQKLTHIIINSGIDVQLSNIDFYPLRYDLRIGKP